VMMFALKDVAVTAVFIHTGSSSRLLPCVSVITLPLSEALESHSVGCGIHPSDSTELVNASE